ncbi:hypothetical protein [Laspinema olomoucense]|uniref:Uncharacterized protein n=1 Tax=Laspinema olomoucense D3b TaxID=2953688 RepID=A0ABT2N4J8_9CYAN|nr:hypothetical protein [Laspinema sp. D3b]MCT7977619.1 hypothetical protein [Laspinema sp. D3b]
MALALLGFADIITIHGSRGFEQFFAIMRIAGGDRIGAKSYPAQKL